MTDYKTLIEKIEYFYIEIIEEFKEAEQRIINDSQFRSLFRKKDYDGNIALLKRCKKLTLDIDVREISIDKGDHETEEVAARFNQSLTAFKALCDSYVQLQVFLKKKSLKEEAKLSTYKEIFSKVEQYKAAVNTALHALDIVYTDYQELYGGETIDG